MKYKLTKYQNWTFVIIVLKNIRIKDIFFCLVTNAIFWLSVISWNDNIIKYNVNINLMHWYFYCWKQTLVMALNLIICNNLIWTSQTLTTFLNKYSIICMTYYILYINVYVTCRIKNRNKVSFLWYACQFSLWNSQLLVSGNHSF